MHPPLTNAFAERGFVGIRKSRVTVSAVALLIAAAVPTLVLQHEAQASPAASKPPPPVATPSASASTPSASTLALSYFASQIETLGVEKYPNSFAGAKLTSAGDTIVYISDPSDNAMISAINALNTSNYPVEFVDVKRSYNQLDALNQQVAAATGQLASEGIDPTEQNPDPATGTIIVNYQSPDTASFSKLASARGLSVTGASYAADASSALQAKFGPDVTLGQEMAPMTADDARGADYPPYYGGDGIINLNNGDGCTGGFNVRNASGSPFMDTAGHCGTATYATTATTIGPTSTNWFTGGSATSPYPTVWDVQAIKINSSSGGGGLGVVWVTRTATEAVDQTLIPAEGATITANGYKDGPVAATVVDVDTITDDIELSPGVYYNATHQVEMENLTPTLICQTGDSGGPVFAPAGPTHVAAVGIITAGGVYTENGIVTGYFCAATLMTSILSGKNQTLITS